MGQFLREWGIRAYDRYHQYFNSWNQLFQQERALPAMSSCYLLRKAIKNVIQNTTIPPEIKGCNAIVILQNFKNFHSAPSWYGIDNDGKTRTHGQ